LRTNDHVIGTALGACPTGVSVLVPSISGHIAGSNDLGHPEQPDDRVHESMRARTAWSQTSVENDDITRLKLGQISCAWLLVSIGQVLEVRIEMHILELQLVR
jgi:hypothetical protein